MTLELLLTGTGRCGTGFIAKVLTEAGMSCTHEGMFTPDGVQDLPETVRAEASWMAVPFLDPSTKTSLPTVLIVRDPVDVVRSLLGIRFFETPGPYRDFAFHHEPDLAGMPPQLAAWEWWIRWNRHAMAHAAAVIDVTSNPTTHKYWAVSLNRVAAVSTSQLVAAAVQVGRVNARPRETTRNATMGVPQRVLDEASDLWRTLFRAAHDGRRGPFWKRL